MTALAAPETGVQTAAERAPEPALTPANFRELLDQRYPTTRTYGPACKILGPQWFTGWENAGREEARKAEEAFRAENREAVAGEYERVYGPLNARLAQWRDESAGTAVAEGEGADSAGPADREAAGPAETSSEGAS